MKKLVLFILLFIISGCANNNITVEVKKDDTDYEGIKAIVSNDNMTVYETIEVIDFDTKLFYNTNNFNLSKNGNLEAYMVSKPKLNGINLVSSSNNILKVDGVFKTYGSNDKIYDVNSLSYLDVMKLNQVFDYIFENKTLELPLSLFSSLLNDYNDNLESNQKVVTKVLLDKNKVEFIVDFNANLKSINQSLNSLIYKYSFVPQVNTIVPPFGVIGDDYKEDLAVSTYPSLSVDPKEVLIKHIDVGQYDTRTQGSAAQDKGESTYIQIGDIDILIDSGQNNYNNAGSRAISEVIDEHSVDGRNLDYVIVTHPHADHYGGLITLLHSYNVKMFIESAGSYSSGYYESYQELRQMQVDKGSKICNATDMLSNSSSDCRQTLQISPSVDMAFLDTGYSTDSAANASSLVFVLTAFNTRYLFTGDAESNQEANYANFVGDVDFLKMPHHGTRNATSEYLLENITTENIIIQNGNNLGNQYGHPTSKTINRIYEYDSSINIYAVTGGGFGSTCTYLSSGEKSCSPTAEDNDFDAYFDPNRFLERNGTISILINKAGYNITSSLDEVLELSKTRFWIENNNRKFSHE